MKTIKLSQRQKNIIRMLPYIGNEPITVQDIADNLDLSSRTVQRDLVGIEEFLESNHFELVKKPGIGIILEEDKSSVDYLYELLDMIDSSKQYGRTERLNFILSRLLTSNQAIKYYAFTTYLNISEKTLVEDLNHIEEWLEYSNLHLIRKRGEGVLIEGNEDDFRKAQSKLIYQAIDDEKRIEILRNITDDVKLELIQENDILSMIDREIINKTRNALNRAFNNLHITLADNAYIGLVVHISLAIERLRLDEKLEFNQEFIDNIVDTQEYIFAGKIVEELEKEFNIRIPNVETSYIAMHIKGANIVAKEQDQTNMDDVLEAHQITKAIIVEMEKIFQLDLINDSRLEHDLRAHLSPALTRLKFNLNIKNPILDDIKTKYKEIFNILKDIAPTIINQLTNIENKNIPDDEIGYIAIHFITAIEKRIIDRVPINVIVVCPTGYGTSRLLASNLNNNIKNINIVANASIMQLNKDYIEENDVDLIISTVNLDLVFENEDFDNLRYIEVPAITNSDDYNYINTVLAELSRDKYYNKEMNKSIDHIEINEYEETTIEYGESSNPLNDTKAIFEMSSNLSKIYEDIRFFNKKGINDLEKLSASIVANTQNELLNITNALKERNKLGGIYFKEYNLYLMHASSDIENPKLAFGRIIDQNKNLIIMISKKKYQKEIIELFSSISSKIIENKLLIEAIENSNTDLIKEIVLKEVLKIIDRKINKGE